MKKLFLYTFCCVLLSVTLAAPPVKGGASGHGTGNAGGTYSVDINLDGGANLKGAFEGFLKSASEALKLLGINANFDHHDSGNGDLRGTVHFSNDGHYGHHHGQGEQLGQNLIKGAGQVADSVVPAMGKLVENGGKAIENVKPAELVSTVTKAGQSLLGSLSGGAGDGKAIENVKPAELVSSMTKAGQSLLGGLSGGGGGAKY